MTAFDKLWLRAKSHSMGRLVLLSALVGVVAGFGALAFNFILDYSG